MGAPSEVSEVGEVAVATEAKVKTGPKPWAYWPFRIIAVAETVLIFDQAVYAGRFLAGDFGGLALHKDNATYTGIVLLVEFVAAIILRWPGGGPLWPALTCIGMFGVIALQIVLGYARVLAIHVPLGVGLITGTVLMLIWAWRPKPGEWVPFRVRTEDET
jgi:hypothetical protein